VSWLELRHADSITLDDRRGRATGLLRSPLPTKRSATWFSRRGRQEFGDTAHAMNAAIDLDQRQLGSVGR